MCLKVDPFGLDSLKNSFLASNIVQAVPAAGRQVLFGLYDNDGILRFIGHDREACVAYADLFDLSTAGCSLMDDLPDYEMEGFNPRLRRRLEARNN